jgi:thiol-disulfide isomerase/thioredoxin
MIEPLIRIGLALILATAAVGKLFDRPGARAALGDFGVPSGLRAPMAILLPLAELGIAALLLPGATATAGLVAASGLLLSFTVTIAAQLARGRRPHCHCFGALHSAPLGPATLARTGALAALSLAALLAGPAARADAWPAGMPATGAGALAGFLAMAIAIGALGTLLMRALRAHGRGLLRIEALESALESAGVPLPPDLAAWKLSVGEEAPAVELQRAGGSRNALRSLIGDGPLALVFTASDCPACQALMPRLGGLTGSPNVALIALGDADGVVAEASEHDIGPVFADEGGKVAAAFDVGVTPTAILIDGEGTIASRPARGEEEILALLGSGPAEGRRHAPSAPATGDPVPMKALPRLGGGGEILGGGGGERIVLFWSSACGHCREIREDVRRREELAPDGLVIVSASSEAELEREGFSAPVLLDAGFTASADLGAPGTPAALAIAPDGSVATPLAVGPEAVRDLLAPRMVEL